MDSHIEKNYPWIFCHRSPDWS